MRRAEAHYHELRRLHAGDSFSGALLKIEWGKSIAGEFRAYFSSVGVVYVMHRMEKHTQENYPNVNDTRGS